MTSPNGDSSASAGASEVVEAALAAVAEAEKVDPDELEAVGDWVVITRRTAPEKSPGGIIMPETARSKMEPEFIGTIVHLGPDVNRERFAVGDRILYTHNYPMTMPGGTGEVMYAYVNTRSIFGKLKKKSKLQVAIGPKNQGLRSPDQGPG